MKWIGSLLIPCLLSCLNAQEREHNLSLFSLLANSLDVVMPHWKTHQIRSDLEYVMQSNGIGTLLVKGGYDYALLSRETYNFLGFGLEYGHSWIDGQDMNSHLVAISFYDTFVHQVGLYLHSSLKYAFLSRDRFLSMILGNVELGYQISFAKHLFFRPSISVSAGYIFPNLGSDFPLFVKTGGIFGVNFWGGISGDVHFGAFFDSDFFYSQERLESKDYRLLLKLGTNFHIAESFHLFLHAKTSFLGKRNLDYGVSVGARFLFGGDGVQAPKLGDKNFRSLKDVQRELLYQSELSRQRVEAKYHLRPNELQNRYDLQEGRNSDFVQEETKYMKRQRLIRESSTWVDTSPNEQNYIKRTPTLLHNRDVEKMKENYKKEMERKYGK